ncbi:hypothetical protein N8315_05015 [Octadecabacter sp.]|nr:hypothetical protein [Octadecabacter sp.]
MQKSPKARDRLDTSLRLYQAVLGRMYRAVAFGHIRDRHAFVRNDARRLAATHVQVTTTVLDNRIVTSNAADDGAETHYVTYTCTRGVPEDFFDTHPVGTAWNIKVHPDHPRIHDLYAGQTRSTAWGHLLLSVLMAAFGAWFGFSDGNWAALRARTS